MIKYMAVAVAVAVAVSGGVVVAVAGLTKRFKGILRLKLNFKGNPFIFNNDDKSFHVN